MGYSTAYLIHLNSSTPGQISPRQVPATAEEFVVFPRKKIAEHKELRTTDVYEWKKAFYSTLPYYHLNNYAMQKWLKKGAYSMFKDTVESTLAERTRYWDHSAFFLDALSSICTCDVLKSKALIARTENHCKEAEVQEKHLTVTPMKDDNIFIQEVEMTLESPMSTPCSSLVQNAEVKQETLMEPCVRVVQEAEGKLGPLMEKPLTYGHFTSRMEVLNAVKADSQYLLAKRVAKWRQFSEFEENIIGRSGTHMMSLLQHPSDQPPWRQQNFCLVGEKGKTGKSAHIRMLIAMYAVPECSGDIINEIQNVRFGMNNAKSSQLYKVSSLEDISFTTMSGPEVKHLLEGRYVNAEIKGGTVTAFAKNRHCPAFISSNIPNERVAKRLLQGLGIRATWSLSDYVKCFDVADIGKPGSQTFRVEEDDGEGRVGTKIKTEESVPMAFRSARADQTCRRCGAMYVRWCIQHSSKPRRVQLEELHIDSDTNTDTEESRLYTVESRLKVVLRRGKRKEKKVGRKSKVLAYVEVTENSIVEDDKPHLLSK
jgi:hypothetical protein